MEGKKKGWEAEQQMRNIESGVGHIDVANSGYGGFKITEGACIV